MSFLSSGDGDDAQDALPAYYKKPGNKRARAEGDSLAFLDDEPSTGPARPRAGHYSSAYGSTSSVRAFSCLWRNLQIVIKGTRATLRDRDTGKEVGQGQFPHASVSSGDEFQIGQKEVQIEDKMDPGEVYSGSAFAKTMEPEMPPAAPVLPGFSKKPKLMKPAAKYEPSFYAPSRPVASSSALRESNANTQSPRVVAKPAKAPEPKHDPDAPDAIVMTRPSDSHASRYNRKGLPIVDVVVDPIIGKKLREHQIEGVKFLYECVMGMKGEGQGAILADEMGLGKTIQSIALCWTLLKQNPYGGNNPVVDRVLVVCPVTLVKNWAREFRKWLGQDRIGVFAADSKADVQMFCNNRNNQVLIIGYEKLRTVAEIIRKAQPPIGVVICDEGHRLKSAGTKTTAALQLFNTPKRIILSGTPIQNDLSEFHAMADYVNPNALDSYQTFKKIYEMPIVRSRDPNCTKQNKELGKARSEQLARLAKLFVLRRTSDVVKGFLPPKFEHTVFVAPTDLQLSLYNAILGSPDIREVFSGGSRHLVLIGTLQKLCNSPGLLYKRLKSGELSKDFAGEELKALFPAGIDGDDLNLSGKLIALSRFLKSIKTHTEEKVILVSNSTKVLDVFETLCKNFSYPFCRLDGSTPQNKRQDIVDRFNRTTQDSQYIFLLSSKSGGTGLNLIGASRLILFDSDWNPSTDLQAMARIHRDGQKRPCHIYRFLTTGTLDEKIYQRQVTKQGLAGSLMDEDGQSGSGSSDAFTLDDLRAIFSLNSSTLCETHDLLGCVCTGEGSSSGGRGTVYDSEEEDMAPGFTAASQFKEAPNPALKRLKLAALRDWMHYDCTSPATADSLEDQPLRELLASSVVRKKQSSKKAVVADDSDDEAMESSPELDGDGARRLKGGQVTFLMTRSSTVEPVNEEEDDDDE